VLVDLAWPIAVLVDAVVWVLWSAVVGWRQARRPWTSLRPGQLGRLRPWEDDGRWYERTLMVRRWKQWLPEAGGWFGGLSKRTRPDLAQGGWRRLAAECLRAERTHGWILLAAPVMAVWNPGWLFVANVVFAVVANVPCLVVSRSTRGRLAPVLTRRGE